LSDFDDYEIGDADGADFAEDGESEKKPAKKNKKAH
jgi:hypothetical protein